MEKIDLKSVKIALERDEMSEVSGGCWGTCAAGGLALMFEYTYSGAAVVGGPWGYAAAFGVGCAFGY